MIGEIGLTETLNIVDKAIKRLVAPVAMFLAAGLISKGLGSPDSNEIVIKSVMVLLSLSAFTYMIFSFKEACEAFCDTRSSALKSVIFIFSFLLVYAVLAFSAIYMGFDKITNV
ncbi:MULTISPECIES: hypothetical protein [Vibrio]|uniref:hypothetical protein n=1 Tax=Vibrio TaxID=662 RepID=UPI0020C5DA3E|nr:MULTISPECIES: hypothetical protein [Vibrio]